MGGITEITRGRKTFQHIYINWSYRIRGNDVRAQTKKMLTSNVIVTNRRLDRRFPPVSAKLKNKILVIREKKRMFMYSAMKIIANEPDLYSVLNPDTSSDSPSARSNGVRLVSARIEPNHNKNRGGILKHTIKYPLALSRL